jgi:hypothetical protein
MSLVQVRQQIDAKLEMLDARMLKADHALLYGPGTLIEEEQDSAADDEADGTSAKDEMLISQLNEIDRHAEAGESKLIPMKDTFEKAEQWLKITK